MTRRSLFGLLVAPWVARWLPTRSTRFDGITFKGIPVRYDSDLLDTTRIDVFDEFQYAWKEYAGTVVLSDQS